MKFYFLKTAGLASRVSSDLDERTGFFAVKGAKQFNRRDAETQGRQHRWKQIFCRKEAQKAQNKIR
jgi:hypothetical protein